MASRAAREPVRGQRAYDALRMYLRNRPDIGLRRATCDGLLESANPFDGNATRLPKRWFVLFCMLAAMGLGFFVYFNKLL
jgi:hypothetical protein